MAIIDFFAGTVIGTLSGMGVGGGGLLVIYLTLAKNMEQTNAQGVNLLFFIFAASASLLMNFKKNEIDKRILMVLIITGIAGTFPGFYTAKIAGNVLMRKIFGCMLLFSGSGVIIKNYIKKKKLGISANE